MCSGISKYKTARVMSGMTQEKAAELAFTSVSTIKRIESGGYCESGMSQRLAEIYKAPWVADPTVPDDYKPLSLPLAAMKFFKETNDLQRLREHMTEIFADGAISKDETEDWNKIKHEIEEARRACGDLMYAG